jgi:hypothetical protein
MAMIAYGNRHGAIDPNSDIWPFQIGRLDRYDVSSLSLGGRNETP